MTPTTAQILDLNRKSYLAVKPERAAAVILGLFDGLEPHLAGPHGRRLFAVFQQSLSPSTKAHSHRIGPPSPDEVVGLNRCALKLGPEEASRALTLLFGSLYLYRSHDFAGLLFQILDHASTQSAIPQIP